MDFDDFKKQAGRMTTTILQKAGAVDKTLDKEFDDQERKFKSLEAKSNTLYLAGKSYLDSVRAMNLAQMKIAETVNHFFDETATLGLCGLKYKDATMKIDTDVRQPSDTDFRNCVLEPISRYNSIFPDVHVAIKRRNEKLLDYDAMRGKVKKLTEKPSDDASKLPRAEQMAMASRDAFERSNNQLKEEIPKLIEGRVGFFDPSFEALVKIQLEYYARSYDHLAPLQNYFGHGAGGDLNGKMQDILQRMRDLSIIKASPPPASNRLSTVFNK